MIGGPSPRLGRLLPTLTDLMTMILAQATIANAHGNRLRLNDFANLGNLHS